MITSPDILRRDTAKILTQVNQLIDNLEDESKKTGVPVHEMRDANNSQMLAPLLFTKVMAINTLADLNTQGRGRRS